MLKTRHLFSSCYPWMVAILFWVIAGVALSDTVKQCSVQCGQGSCSASCSAPRFCPYCRCKPRIECGCRPASEQGVPQGKMVQDGNGHGSSQQPPKT